jgi:hypothetical protein
LVSVATYESYSSSQDESRAKIGRAAYIPRAKARGFTPHLVKAASKMEAAKKITTMVVTSATTVRDIRIQDFKVIDDDDAFA